MKTLKNIFQSLLFQHLLFWVTVAFLLLLPDFNKGDLISLQVVLQNFTTLSFLALAVYLNLLILIPRFLRTRRYGFFVLFQLVNILLFFVLDVFAGTYLFNYDYTKAFDSEISASARFAVLFLSEALLVFFFIAVTTFIKLLRDWITMQDNSLKLKEMERQKLEAELQSLKSQINPHFLFNTLNNIYALALDESEKTPDMILKLSDLMRYIIYDCRSPKVKLSKETEFIRNYIALEQLRLDGKIKTEFFCEMCEDIELPPLIFVNFLENAFKHASKTEGSYISVRILVEKSGELLFHVENSKEE
ncbi:MAG: sensor histidine kinase, partial [Candidatus Izemoplasmatales bacterium]